MARQLRLLKVLKENIIDIEDEGTRDDSQEQADNDDAENGDTEAALPLLSRS